MIFSMILVKIIFGMFLVTEMRDIVIPMHENTTWSTNAARTQITTDKLRWIA